jgi:hypothetical protein
MRSLRVACVLGVLLLAALGKTGTSVADTRLGHTLRAFGSNFRTIEGEKPPLNPLDRLVLGVILSNPKSCRQ